MITAGAGAAATAGNTGLDLSTIAGDLVGGGVGGAVLTLIVGIVRKMKHYGSAQFHQGRWGKALRRQRGQGRDGRRVEERAG
ncbi:hypothetical protein G6F57_021080 [Rhizopus arrhizus]|nr:hypothetical protein G6F57_021080 [Rhizopus arrhizus]